MVTNMPARKDLPQITIGPHLRRELSVRLLELAFEIEAEVRPLERAAIQDKFAAIADLLSDGREGGTPLKPFIVDMALLAAIVALCLWERTA